jgi:hypothetical protein
MERKGMAAAVRVYFLTYYFYAETGPKQTQSQGPLAVGSMGPLVIVTLGVSTVAPAFSWDWFNPFAVNSAAGLF